MTRSQRHLAEMQGYGSNGERYAEWGYGPSPWQAYLPADIPVGVPIPFGFDWNSGITPYRSSNGTYSSNFDIDARKPAIVKTYYVNPTRPDNSGDGLSWSAAKRDLSVVLALSDWDEIVLDDNGGTTRRYFGVQGWNSFTVTRQGSIRTRNGGRAILLGTAATTVPTWVPVSGAAYKTTIAASATTSGVTDLKIKDADGFFYRMSLVANAAAVITTPGSYFHDGVDLHVRASDGRNLVGDLDMIPTFNSNNGRYTPTSSKTLWMSNIDFVGGLRTFYPVFTTSGIVPKVYWKNCSFQNGGTNGLSWEGPGECYLVGCKIGGHLNDGINQHIQAGIPTEYPRLFHQDCVISRNGFNVGGTSNNADTNHELNRTISINARIITSQNRVIHFINAAKLWMLGGSVGASLDSGVQGATVEAGDTVEMWLDGCVIAHNALATLDIKSNAAAKIHYARMSLAGLTTGGGGIIDTYAPLQIGPPILTPYDSIGGLPGARGGARLGTCNVTGSSITGGLTSGDVGKLIMIAGAGTAGRDWVTTVQSSTTLTVAAPTAVTGAVFHVGWDDQAALQRWMSTPGEHILPLDTFLCQQAPLKYTSNSLFTGQGGTLLFGPGWPSSYSILNETYVLPVRAERQNVFFEGAALVKLSPACADIVSPNLLRKGIGITNTNGFGCTWNVEGLTGPNGFGITIFNSSNGYVTNSVIDIRTTSPGGQGGDGIHFLGNCSNITCTGLDIDSADDSTSHTQDNAGWANTTISHIEFVNCNLLCVGHSNIKALITAAGSASIIENITYRDCHFSTELSPGGAGVPHIIYNQNRAGSAHIRDILIIGGDTNATNLTVGNYGMLALDAIGIERLRLENHNISYAGRSAIRANDCPEFSRIGGSITPLRTAPADLAKFVVELINCPSASWDLTNVNPSFAGQTIYSST